MLSNEVTGMVTWIGTILGLIGLSATFLQAMAARKQASAAHAAAESARASVQDFKGRLGVANSAYSYSQIELVKRLVQTESISPAQMIFHCVKRDIHEILGVIIDGAEGKDVGTMKKNMRIVEHQLDLGVRADPSFKPAKATKALSGISDFLATSEQVHKYR